MKIKILLLSLAALALLSGCTVLNPYEENFKCPRLENGKCVSLQTAYDLSKEDVVPAKRDCKDCKDKGCKKSCKGKKGELEVQEQEMSPLEGYQVSFYDELKTLIDQPETPLVVPPKVMRVLILDYQDGEELSGRRNLFGKRHVYMMVDQPRWIFGN